MQIVGQTWLNLVTWTCGSWSEGLHDLSCTVQWFCLIAWRLFDVCTWYFRIMTQYEPTFDLKVIVGHCDLYIHGPVIVPYTLKTISCMNIIICDYESVWPDAWPQNKCKSLWPIFHGQWFCVISWRLFDVWTLSLGIMGQYYRTFDLKINVCYCDLYFMVHWFCLISQRLFDGWVSYFQIMRKCDPNLYLKINTGQHDLYFMV